MAESRVDSIFNLFIFKDKVKDSYDKSNEDYIEFLFITLRILYEKYENEGDIDIVNLKDFIYYIVIIYLLRFNKEFQNWHAIIKEVLTKDCCYKTKKKFDIQNDNLEYYINKIDGLRQIIDAEAAEAQEREAQERARKEAQERARKEAEEKARADAEAAAEEKARADAEARAAQERAEKARVAAAEENARVAAAKERAKKEAEDAARKEADEKAKKEADEKAKKEAEDAAKKEAEEKAKKEAEEKAKKEAEEKAKKEAEERAKKEAEERAKKEAEEKAKKEAEEKAKKEDEEKAKKEAEEKAKKEAEEKAKKEDEEKAKKEAEERAYYFSYYITLYRNNTTIIDYYVFYKIYSFKYIHTDYIITNTVIYIDTNYSMIYCNGIYYKFSHIDQQRRIIMHLAESRSTTELSILLYLLVNNYGQRISNIYIDGNGIYRITGGLNKTDETNVINVINAIIIKIITSIMIETKDNIKNFFNEYEKFINISNSN